MMIRNSVKRSCCFSLTALTLSLVAGLSTAAEPAQQIRQAAPAAQDKLLEEYIAAADEPVAAIEDSSSNSTEVLKIRPGTTLYLTLTEDSQSPAAPLLKRQSVFVVNDAGQLILDKLAKIPLAGLSASEAVLRLKGEPLFQGESPTLSILPADTTDAAPLQRFGSRLFSSNPQVQSLDNLPVPEDYVLGAGDQISVQLTGAEIASDTYTVSREGTLELPQLGPIAVAGSRFQVVKERLAGLYAEKLIGTEAHVSMGALRSIQVRVLGEVGEPGSYVVGSLASVVDVLAAAGGISDIGSFRTVRVERGGKVLAELDLYRLLTTGEFEDTRLLAGDTVFVPVAKKLVSISGQVKRPAVYELTGKASIREAIALAGGLQSGALQDNIRVHRDNGEQLLQVDLATGPGRDLALQDGDQVTVVSQQFELAQQVRVSGEVLQPGDYALQPGLRLSTLLASAGLRHDTDRATALLVRASAALRPELLIVSPAQALQAGSTAADPLLRAGDSLYLFSTSTPGQRSSLLLPLINELQQQTYGSPRLVAVNGAVAEPGTYPLTRNMRVSDLLALAGQIQAQGPQQGLATQLELSRAGVDAEGNPLVTHRRVSLASVRDGSDNPMLQAWDTVTVKRDPRYSEQHTVQLAGEVRYPGVYRVAPGEQLSSLIQRAGGLTVMAFPAGAVLVRESISESQKRELQQLADQIELGLKSTILERADETIRPAESLQVASDVVTLLRDAEPMGRLVFDLPRLVAESNHGKLSDADITLFDGDQLYIPPVMETVSVVGEVHRPTSHVFQDQFSAMDYVSLSGGITSKSKQKLIYLVRADGSAKKLKSGWRKTHVQPGDTIVVPLNVEKIRGLRRWQDITGILANLITPSAAMVNAAAAWKTAEAIEHRENINVNW
ncbi:SLBB domain-containing protein [Teredinibacter turnerae]|uniref:SLBB domain-containing protein n=1 Tax=Teredinibacter turnerae TaxID=2426 RepID=UPI0005F7B254|nr:SLBB domain-containing protein [Teredinibacter turnerae]